MLTGFGFLQLMFLYAGSRPGDDISANIIGLSMHGLAVILFILGILSDNPKEQALCKKGLAVLVAVYGIILFLMKNIL